MKNTKTNTLSAFLEKYKELEGILRASDSSQTILQYEETLPADDMERLRICRQIRNYVQHHEDGVRFLTATEEMLKFIESLIQSEAAKNGVVKDRMYRLSAITPADTLSVAMGRFASSARPWLPVTGENGEYVGILRCIPFIQIYSLLRNTAKIKTVLADEKLSKKLEVLPSVSKDTPLDGLQGKDLIVTGKDGKYLGIVKW